MGDGVVPALTTCLAETDKIDYFIISNEDFSELWISDFSVL